MENKPNHPDWKQLQKLLKECSNSEIDSLPVDIDSSFSEGEAWSQSNHQEETISHEENTNNLTNRVKRLEEIIEKQNQIIHVKNTYISILEQKLKEWEEKQSNPPETIYTHIGESFNSDNETKKPLQKIADLNLHIQNLQEQIQLIKKRRKI